MKKISMCLICLLLLTGCKINETAVLTEECLIPVEFTHIDDIQDFDGENFFVVSSESGDGISQTGNLVAKIMNQNNSEKVFELGEYSTGFYPVIFDDEKVYAVVDSEKIENINKKEMVSVPLGGIKTRTVYEGIPNLSNMYQMKKSDNQIVFFCSNETLNGYEYEIFVYDISTKKSERVIHFVYDNEKVFPQKIIPYGENGDLLFSVDYLSKDEMEVLRKCFKINESFIADEKVLLSEALL